MNTGTTNATKKTADTAKPVEIFVVMEGGVVQEIVNLPPDINVTVIDYDTEGVEKDRLEISPVDGELCVINKW
jgi:hypothetical protein